MGVEMAEKKVIDWGVVELAYRAGIKTLRVIGEENGITHGAIRKRAEKDGWSRDLGAKIRAKADDLVSKQMVSSLVSKITERVEVDTQATVQATIRIEQREDISKFRKHVMKLSDELEACEDDLSKRIGGSKALIESFKTLVAMQREAFGIDSRFEDEEVKAVAADPQDLARRIAFLLAQSIHKGT